MLQFPRSNRRRRLPHTGDFWRSKNYDRLEEGRLWTLLPSKFPPPQKMVGLWQPEFPALEFAGEIFVKPFSFKLVFQGISWDGLTVNHRKMVAHFWKKNVGLVSDLW